jgi:chemotaxis signal transduction protein
VSDGSSRPAFLAAALRREFDDAFARVPHVDRADGVKLLAVVVGQDPHAMRLSEIAGLFVDRRITPVPGPLPELLGVAHVRGVLVPVYDLRLVLGYPAGPPPRWLVVAAARPVALAFDQLDGHLVVSPDSIADEPGATSPDGQARAVVEVPGRGRASLLRVPSLVDDIAARARRAGSKEQ